jgi:hypothetical protein
VLNRLRDSLRLIANTDCVELQPASLPPDIDTSGCVSRDSISVTVLRFDETIGGRAYHIEVMPVSNRWRAQLCRTPGLPTAMMPFYGATPDEAARLLAKWLTLAHGARKEPPGLPERLNGVPSATETGPEVLGPLRLTRRLV